MKTFTASIFLLSFVFINLGCKDPNSLPDNSNLKLNTPMITFDIYKGTSDIGLSLIYIGKQSAILVKPTGQQLLDFEEIPPPPNKLKSSSNLTEYKMDKIETEILKLEKEAVKKIENLIGALDDNDLKTIINSGKFDDGIGIKVTIIFSENNIKDFSLINGATENQRAFLKYIFDQSIQKSKLNKEQLTFFLR